MGDLWAYGVRPTDLLPALEGPAFYRHIRLPRYWYGRPVTPSVRARNQPCHSGERTGPKVLKDGKNGWAK
jgi:hypothetical protein